jgi:hypothetical protein
MDTLVEAATFDQNFKMTVEENENETPREIDAFDKLYKNKREQDLKDVIIILDDVD